MILNIFEYVIKVVNYKNIFFLLNKLYYFGNKLKKCYGVNMLNTYFDSKEFWHLIFVSVISFIVLFVIAKLLGKRQISQLEFVDYIMGITIGSIFAEMATDINDKPFYYYLIAVVIYFLFDILVNVLGRKAPFLKHFLKGKPLVIIYEGEINYKNLKRSKLSVNDIISLARE